MFYDSAYALLLKSFDSFYLLCTLNSYLNIYYAFIKILKKEWYFVNKKAKFSIKH
jgi:hypothetical protein